jgi:uncharacterized protein (DUF983 family)
VAALTFVATLMFAQAVPYSIGQWLIIALVVAGIIGIFLVVSRQAGINVPPWLINILWIVLAVFCGVIAIRFLLGMI